MRRAFLAAAAALVLGGPALAAPADWTLSPLEARWGDVDAALGGQAGSDLYAAAGPRQRTGTGLVAQLFARADDSLDNGWELGLRAAVLALHDRLAGDTYGDRAVEKAYLFVQTPYGRFEAGEDDGAGYRLAVTGPGVDPAVAIDDAGTTFFRDPTTGRAVIDLFRLRAAVFAGANAAKFSYMAPRWHGLQLAASYAPSDARGGLPLVTRRRPSNIVEAAANYSGSAGRLGYGLYAALAADSDGAAGNKNVVDWGMGGEADYSFDEGRLALGGAYRRADDYAFDIRETAGAAQSWRASATFTQGPWIFGLETAVGRTARAGTRPALTETGVEPSLGYVVNADLQLTAGWQSLRMRRDAGVFFDGSNRLALSAAFLRLRFHV